MRSSRVLALALGVLLAILLLRPSVGVAAATTTTHPPTATATPIPTQTPYPTYTPPATQTPYPSPTVVPSPSPIPQGVNPAHPTQYCTGLLNWHGRHGPDRRAVLTHRARL